MLSCVSLLLLGCLSCAEAIRGNTVDELSLNEQLVDRAEKIIQEACKADIHAALREMTAVMTEQRIQLQTTMDRLKDSETVIKEQRVQLQTSMDRLKDREGLIKELQVEQQELRAAMERLTDSDIQIKASVATIDARSNTTEHEVQSLQKLNEDSQVSFSATFLASGSGPTYTGPYNDDTILIYKHVITNVGNGYNPNTGFFTAVRRGVHHFSFYLHSHGGSLPTFARLFKNGQSQVSAYGHQPRLDVSSSNGISLLLEAGDEVCVKLVANSRMYDNQVSVNSFSGQLLFAM